MAKPEIEDQDDDEIDDGDDGGLTQLTALVAEIDSHHKRLRKTAKAEVDAPAEVRDTVMSLLNDLSKLVQDNVLYLRDWADEVSDELWGDEAAPAGDDDDSVLLPEDAELFRSCLAVLHASLAASSQQVTDETQRAEVVGLIAQVERALARIAEITVDDDDDGPDDEDDDEDGDDEATAGQAEAPLPDGSGA